jgi:hypothetical protein
MWTLWVVTDSRHWQTFFPFQSMKVHPGHGLLFGFHDMKTPSYKEINLHQKNKHKDFNDTSLNINHACLMPLRLSTHNLSLISPPPLSYTLEQEYGDERWCCTFIQQTKRAKSVNTRNPGLNNWHVSDTYHFTNRSMRLYNMKEW